MNQSRLKLNFPKCTICLKAFDAYYHMPRVIPKCGHTFCQKCIKIKLISKYGRMIFACPDCSTEVHIRKAVVDELPRNISILELLKSQTSSEHIEEPEPSNICNLHHKKKDLICRTCKQILICSHCAVFGTHKGHDIGSEELATSEDLKQLKEYIGILQDSIEEVILPNSPNNIQHRAKQKLQEKLSKQVRKSFEKYYEEIRKKQQQILAQCSSIVLGGTGADTIDSILQSFDQIKVRTRQLETDATRTQIDDLLDQIKTVHELIEALEESYQVSVDKFIQASKIKLQQTLFFNIHVSDFRGLNSILNQSISSKEEKTYKKYKTEISEKGDKVESRQKGQITQKDKKDKKQTLTPLQKNRPPSLRPSIQNVQINEWKNLQAKADKQQNSSSKQYNKMRSVEGRSDNRIKKSIQQIQQINLDLNFNRQNNKKSPRHDIRKNIQTQRPQVKKMDETNNTKSVSLQYRKPIKDLNYQQRSKFQHIVDHIGRQETGGTLELIGLEIKDEMLMHICQHLRVKKLQFSMIKLVKNGISDEGLRSMLSYLCLDSFTKVLNLTNNQLTNKSLKMIQELIYRNNILKTIYVSNNKITPIQLKKMQPLFQSKFVQVIL